MFIGSELFRQGPRPKAMAVIGVTLWIATMAIAIGFEPLQVSRSHNTQGEVTSHNLWQRYGRHFVGITWHNVGVKGR